MKPDVKALLLGVDIRFNDQGTSDPKRKQLLTKALERLTILTDYLKPDTLSSMLDCGEEVILWLHEHPKAHVTLGYWHIELESPEFSDVDYERFDWPFGLNGAVEEYSRLLHHGADLIEDCWSVCWSIS